MKRISFNKGKRKEFLTKFNNKFCGCDCKVEAKGFQLDHIKPLASGGTDDDQNIQVLCKGCQMMKCKAELESHGDVKIFETASSFNQQVFDIITDKLANAFSFVERVKGTTHNQG